MNGTLLRCYVHENQLYHGKPVWEAMVMYANGIGVRGASVFKAMAGFGRHHIVHEGPRPFSLKAMETVQMEFIVTQSEAQQLLQWVQQQGIRMFYASTPAQFATIDGSAADQLLTPQLGDPPNPD